MCGRFFIQIDKKDLEEIIAEVEANNQDKEGLASLKLEGEIFPTDTVVVKTATTITPMKWGFKVGKGIVINARSETVTEKSMFRDAVLEHRCAIAASGYYEWKQTGSTKKTKYQFYLPDHGLLYLAGCYRVEHDSPLPTFVILTREADPQFTEIHDRMPVALTTQQADAWLRPGDIDLDETVKNSVAELETALA